MKSVAILGAGELGATLARLLADREALARVVLVDADVGRARGKALDLMQSGPVEGSDTQVLGAATLAEAGAYDALVVADPTGTTPGEGLAQWAPAVGRACLIWAGPRADDGVGASVRAGLSRAQVLGSAALAYHAALRRLLAAELGLSPLALDLALLGRLPEYAIVPRGSARAGGLDVDALSTQALRRAREALRRHTPGPVALATAAAAVLRALAGAATRVLPVTCWLEGEYGLRGVALCAPARLGAGRMAGVVEVALEPVDRVAFESAAQRAGA
jgi:malate dehydrogenase